MTVATQDLAVEAVDQTIGYNVHGLLYRHRHSQKELAMAMAITPSVLSKKLRGESAWSARQVAVTAEFLGVQPGRLFEATVPNIRPNLRSIRGEGRDLRPRTPLLTSL